jgi:CO/xanthine dehydrogenase Mo-binding subunit/aerobic-type carbon monoxide dehydrogenase small subunit (CoxS/CutS family)
MITVNGQARELAGDQRRRLLDVLREDFGLTGVKNGCGTGDCGACTVLLDGVAVNACLTVAGRARGAVVTTVEGLGQGRLTPLQQRFLDSGAVQCGFCTPGMLMSATAGEGDARRVLAGNLCRCTGYRKIAEALAGGAPEPTAPTGQAVGARVRRIDGIDKVTGRACYGADGVPADALWVRMVRSPHHRARFTLGDLAAWQRGHEGIALVLTAADVPSNRHGVGPGFKDQPVFAEGEVRFLGEAVLALVGTRGALADVDTLPVTWHELSPVTGIDQAMAPGAELVHPHGNLMLTTGVEQGDAAAQLAVAAFTARGRFTTAAVEHAYLEPEAGWADSDGEHVTIHVSTQAPYQDRDETARVLGLRPEQVEIRPTACGGGFGGKLDLSLHPVVALAALRLRRPVACVYSRAESLAASTKRHPARIDMAMGCDAEGRLVAVAADLHFDTGAYSSWGPTVVNRVPIHATGPYRVRDSRCRASAWFTHAPPSGAFRGFGVPQAAFAHEALMDDLALQAGIDRLEMRRRNAFRPGDVTPTGQRLGTSVGLGECLDALAPRWQAWLAESEAFNRQGGEFRRGVGIGCLWYGIGNTATLNPSTVRVSLEADGHIRVHAAAADIGQGISTVLAQVVADTMDVPMAAVQVAAPFTGSAPDAGKTSASRQTFLTGKAAMLAATALRAEVTQRFGGLEQARGHTLSAQRTDEPATEPLNSMGQGKPYASYAFGAQIAQVEVDTQTGVTRVLNVAAAHDVGRAINPAMAEGQIEGGILQGLGMALLECFVPGHSVSLHKYLIPSIAEMPDIDVHLIEVPEPMGPFGAKGVGEPAIIATAPAIAGAIRHATGIRVDSLPVTPERLWQSLQSG